MGDTPSAWGCAGEFDEALALKQIGKSRLVLEPCLYMEAGRSLRPPLAQGRLKKTRIGIKIKTRIYSF